MKLFSRAHPETPAKPARRGHITCGDLEGALAPVRAQLDTESSTVQMLDRLLATGADDSDPVVPGAVTVAELDAAIAEVRELDVPASTLSVLKRVRVLIANAETQRAKAGAALVSREEFEALARMVGVTLGAIELARNRTGFADGTIAYQLVRAVGEDAAERAALKAITKAFDGHIEAHRAADRRRHIDQGNAYYRV
jgi:hypothetical protein